jgi:hypothetical protein
MVASISLLPPESSVRTRDNPDIAMAGLPTCGSWQPRPFKILAGARWEIGEVLEIPTSTVGDTVDRAIKKLAEKCDV